MTETVQRVLDTAWLGPVLRATSDVVFLLDDEHLTILHANGPAHACLRQPDGALTGVPLAEIAREVDADQWARYAVAAREAGRDGIAGRAWLTRRDGSHCLIEGRLFWQDGEPATLIAVGRPIDLAPHPEADPAGAAVPPDGLHAVTANAPGMVYEFTLEPDGRVGFPYASKGCQALLGIAPDALRADPRQFDKQILPEDRASYLESMERSATALSTWNWEGRVFSEAWQDVKWINLRATPRRSASGGVRWFGIMSNITLAKMSEQRIERSRRQLSELNVHSEVRNDAERKRLAREIHDELGGNLTAIKIGLSWLIRHLPEDRADCLERARYIDTVADRTFEALRRIAADLRPAVLDLGLVPAIQWHLQQITTQLGIQHKLVAPDADLRLSQDASIVVYRIVQEALTNVAKHAQAKRVRVTIDSGADGLLVEVTDDGVGLPQRRDRRKRSYGILGMTEWAATLGGELTVERAARRGTIVRLKLPRAGTGEQES